VKYTNRGDGQGIDGLHRIQRAFARIPGMRRIGMQETVMRIPEDADHRDAGCRSGMDAAQGMVAA
jgi:hypothetical protein